MSEKVDKWILSLASYLLSSILLATVELSDRSLACVLVIYGYMADYTQHLES